MCPDTCEPICLKLSMMLDTSELCTLIPAWMTSMLTVIKQLLEATQMFMIVDYVIQMALKRSSKFGEYGSF